MGLLYRDEQVSITGPGLFSVLIPRVSEIEKILKNIPYERMLAEIRALLSELGIHHKSMHVSILVSLKSRRSTAESDMLLGEMTFYPNGDGFQSQLLDQIFLHEKVHMFGSMRRHRRRNFIDYGVMDNGKYHDFNEGLTEFIAAKIYERSHPGKKYIFQDGYKKYVDGVLEWIELLSQNSSMSKQFIENRLMYMYFTGATKIANLIEEAEITDENTKEKLYSILKITQ